MINLKLSTNYTSVTYRGISLEKALELTKCNIGTNGPHKITIDWTDDVDLSPTTPVDVPTTPVDVASTVPLVGDTVVVDVEVPKVPPVGQTSDYEPAPVIDDTPGNAVDELPDMQQDSLGDLPRPVVLSEISKIERFEFTTTKFIPLESNLFFAETSDGRLSIKYAGTKINTTWKELVRLEQSVRDPIPARVDLLKERDVGNRRTAVIKFIRKMRDKNIKQGDCVGLFDQIFNHKSEPGKSKDGIDPDADFRPTGVGSSVYPPSSPAGQDFGSGGLD